MFVLDDAQWDEFVSKITNWNQFCASTNIPYTDGDAEEIEQKITYLKNLSKHFVAQKIWRSLIETSNNGAAQMLEELLGGGLTKEHAASLNEEIISPLINNLLDSILPSEFFGLKIDIKTHYCDLILQKQETTYPLALLPPVIEENDGVNIQDSDYTVSDILNKNSDIFEERMIIITGPHGSGKSSVLRKLFVDGLSNITKNVFERKPVFPLSINAPILYSMLCKNKQKTIDLTQIVHNILELNKVPGDKEKVIEQLKKCSIILLIDRFDELSIAERLVIEKAIEVDVLNLASNDYILDLSGIDFKPQKFVLVTEDFSSVIGTLKGCVLKILPLTPKQMEAYAVSVAAENNIKITDKDFKDVCSSFFSFNLSSPIVVLLTLGYFGIIAVQSRSMNTFAMFEAVIKHHIKTQKVRHAGKLDYIQLVAMNDNMVYDWITILCFVYFKLKQKSSKVSRGSIIELFAQLKRAGFALDTYSFAGHYDCLVDFSSLFENTSTDHFEAKHMTVIHFLVARFLLKGLGREPNALAKWNNVKQTLAKYCNSEEFIDWRKDVQLYHTQIVEFIGYGVNSWNQYYLALEKCFGKAEFAKLQEDFLCNSLLNRGDLRFSNLSVEYVKFFIRHCHEAKVLSKNAVLAFLVLAGQFRNIEDAKKSKWDAMFQDTDRLVDQIASNIFPELEPFIVPHNIFYISDKPIEEIAKLKFAVNPTFYALLPQEVKDDRDRILSSLDQNIQLFSYLEEKYRQDKEILQKVVAKNVSLLKYAPITVRDDKAIIEELCKINVYSYKYAGELARKDRALATHVVTKCAKLFKYADATIREDKVVALAAIATNSVIIRYMNPIMFEEEEFVLELVKSNYFTIHRLQKLIRTNESLKKLIVEQVPEVRALMKQLFNIKDETPEVDEIYLDITLEDEVFNKEEEQVVEEPPKVEEQEQQVATLPPLPRKKRCVIQ